MKTILSLVVVGLILSNNLLSQSITVKIGTVAPSGTPWSDIAEELKKRVKEESNGNIKVKVYLGGQLGGEIEMVRGIRSNRIEAGGITTGALATAVPELEVLELPYLFENNDQVDWILDNKMLEDFRTLFAKKDLVFVTWAENGWRSLGTKSKQIKVPADLKGVKIRSQEAKVHLAYWNKIGASAVPIAIPEVLPALQTGVVDGFDNTPLFTMAADWSSAIQYYTVTKHIYQPAAVVYGKKFFDAQTPENQKILLGPGNEIAIKARKDVRKLDKRLFDILKSKNIQIYEPSSAELGEWKKASEGIAEATLGKLGGESRKVYNAILQAKKEYKK